MIFKNLLAINAMIAVPMGLACVLAPAQLLAGYAVSPPPRGDRELSFSWRES